MGLWDRMRAAVAVPAPYRAQPTPRQWGSGRSGDPLAFTIDIAADLRAAWLGQGAWAPKVSREEALSVPAVKRVRDLICATLGTLELREVDPARNVIESDLLGQPEVDVPASITYTRLAEDLLFEEHGWWRITEFDASGEWPRHVRRLEPRSVNVQVSGKVYASPDGRAQGLAWEEIPDRELIRFDSPWPALLVHGARTIRDAMAVARAASRNVSNPVPPGYFSPVAPDGADPEDPPDVQEILDDWQDAVDADTIPYLNAALRFNPLGFSPEQLQFSATRDAIVLEIARLGNIDPEELGVSTTSRTYANAEQRRLDLLDFTVAPLAVAIRDRLSMDDVTFPGNRATFVYDGFLKSDTLTRMQVYDTGRKVGAYDDQRVAEAEGLPVQRVRAARQQAAATQAQSQPAAPSREANVSSSLTYQDPAPVAFAASGSTEIRFGFDLAPDVVQFKTSVPRRTVSGLVIPWNTVARSLGYKWKFAPNSLHWTADSRVKLDKDHIYGSEFGRAHDGGLTSTDVGLAGSFSVAPGPDGDLALAYADHGTYDGFSAFVTFESEADGWTPDPADETVRLVHSATLRKVALTAMPAFDSARVQSVAATHQNGDAPMTAPAAAPPAPAHTGPLFDTASAQAFAAALTAGLTGAVAEASASAVVEAIRALPSGSLVTPTRQVVPAGGAAVVTREAPVYAMNGQGPSFVRDAWRSRTQGDLEARDRLMKFERMTTDMVNDAMRDPASFAVTTGNAGGVIPPGFRPDLYVSQLLRGRPLTNMISRGTISDATPFKIPAFVSSSGATATHVEGVNPTDGSLSVGTITVSPGGVSGKYTITREIADSSNPAIDAIATQAMSESWSQQTEGLTYAKLNGTDGVGGVITSDFVPSGAQAYAVTVDISDETPAYGKAFAKGIRSAQAKYPFRRFSGIDWAACSQEGAVLFAEAMDTTGRALFPWLGAQNVVGTANTSTQGYVVDGVVYAPAWSMSGNAAGDADLLFGNRNDAWYWESPVLNFRFEEVSGPANVVLALFGYFAVEILRPVGLTGVRVTIQA